ncbi:hypothetical protein NGA_0320600 [Nannochloropsis gaditana CCMP526]|uniref:uncharacterized protein n=1 Tax=Nannochloropsis gaditana (strain CCMP526) TaxID=1093141 RepID=UPI00029F595B|nr:hypothetical protein NGA_0320600 [Nannochloropsis gaditana CCMP526]EKU20175.1 hypothetical protein NGA_0320600 [Nannochloropsis gaditana CCMP526]|eukprot:XP_005856195.1 hypothetical protein NGA_0320600 [Nannochloropsis gaditana CCMP526]
MPTFPGPPRFSRDLCRIQEHFQKFSALVECVIDMSALPDLSISPAHDPALAELKEEIDEVEDHIENTWG